MSQLNLRESVKAALDSYLAAHDATSEPKHVYHLVIDEVESIVLKRILDYADKNQVQAAKILGISRNTLHRKLKQYRIRAAK